MKAQGSHDDMMESIQEIYQYCLPPANAFCAAIHASVTRTYAQTIPPVLIDRKAAILGERLIRKFKSSFLSSQLD